MDSFSVQRTGTTEDGNVDDGDHRPASHPRISTIGQLAIADCDGVIWAVIHTLAGRFLFQSIAMKLDPISLKLFVAVMETGTIADAAVREHIAASAVSKRISELERALNIALFARSNKGAVATAAAYALLNLARGVLNSMDDIVYQLSEYASGMRGHVRVFANISAITQFLSEELKSFMVDYPLVQIHLEERISSVIAKAVADNAADIGILNTGNYGENVALLPYHKDELIAIVPDGHPLARRKSTTLRQALAFDFVGLHPGSSINNQLTKSAGDIGKPLKLRMQVASYDALCLMVAAGLGIGVMPRKSAQLYLRSLKIKPIRLAEPWATRQLVVCVRSYTALSTASKALVEHLCGQNLTLARPVSKATQERPET